MAYMGFRNVAVQWHRPSRVGAVGAQGAVREREGVGRACLGEYGPLHPPASNRRWSDVTVFGSWRLRLRLRAVHA